MKIDFFQHIIQKTCDWGLVLNAKLDIVECFHSQFDLFTTDSPFLDYFRVQDQHYIQEIFVHLEKSQTQTHEKRLYLKLDEKKILKAYMNASLFDKDGDTFFAVTISKMPRFDETMPHRQEHTYFLYDRLHFSPLAKRFLKLSLDNLENYQLTFIQMNNIDDLLDNMDKHAFHKWQLDVAAMLKALSAGGDAVAYLTKGKFAFIHMNEIQHDIIYERINKLYQEHTDQPKKIELYFQTLDFTLKELNEIDAFRCIDFLLLKFSFHKIDQPFILDIHETMQFFVKETLDRISLLRKTIDEQNFDIVFQPIYDLKTNEIHHYEALSRITGADTPSKLIHFAEETGMIQDFDLAVFQKTLEVLKEKTDDNESEHIKIAINISAQSLESQLFLNELELILEPFAYLRPLFMFEITETSQILDFDQANLVIQGLRQKGHLVCLDDVGSGSTSFLSLNQLNVDFAKIEGNYIQQYQTDPRQKSILETIVKACQKLNIPMIAEKIENEEQFKYVKSLNIEYGQGFYLGKPDSF